MVTKRVFNKFIVLILFLFNFNTTTFSRTNFLLAQNDSNNSALNNDYLKKLPSYDYILGTGDSILVKVSEQYPELDSIVTVDGTGTIYLPRLKRVFVKDLTVNELIKLLNLSYKEFVKYPMVEVEIIKYRPIKIIINGEVENPGLHVLSGYVTLEDAKNTFYFQKKNTDQLNQKPEELTFPTFYFPTLFDVIRKAEGLTRYSDLNNIEVFRKNSISNGGGMIKTKLNFNEVFKGESSKNIRILDGDLIKVNKLKNGNNENIAQAIRSNINPKIINVFVFGRVRDPGSKVLPRISTLNDAILLAGGSKFLKGPVTHVSYMSDGNIKKSKFRYRKNAKNGTKRNPFLKNNDLILVDTSFVSNSAEVINEVSAPFTGLLSVYGIIKAFE